MSSTIALPSTLNWVPLPTPLPADYLTTATRRTPTMPVPCRRCLRDIVPGKDPALLFSYDPFPASAAASPYRGATAIFVHAPLEHNGDGSRDTADKKAEETAAPACALADVRRDFGGMVPQQQARWRLAVRGYDAKGCMVAFEIVEGADVVPACEGMLLKEREGRVEYVHLYYAAPGCFAVRVERAE